MTFQQQACGEQDVFLIIDDEDSSRMRWGMVQVSESERFHGGLYTNGHPLATDNSWGAASQAASEPFIPVSEYEQVYGVLFSDEHRSAVTEWLNLLKLL
jgi:hypothetical protein